MKTILFDIHASTGHIHATLKMAGLLSGAGYTIIYALPHEYQNMVVKHGFKTCLNIPWFNLRKNAIQNVHNSGIEPDELAEIRKSLEIIKPDLIILDEIESYKALFYKILGHAVVLSQSMPDPLREKHIPPFTSYRLVANSIFYDFLSTILWYKRIARFWFRLFYNKVKTGWDDIHSQTSAITKKHGINFYKSINVQSCSSPVIKGIPRIIISPAPFDFPHQYREHTYRIGPLVDIKREKKIESPRYSVLMDRISQIKGLAKGKIIYVSMGTVSNYDIKRCTKFLKKIRKVANMIPEHLFVLSTGKFFDVNRLMPLPDNLMVFEKVPQVDLLQRSDIMITHGGMNSITECIFSETPMLVYPLSRRWDQPGNSARVVFHKIGLRGRIERDSVKTIAKKLEQLIDNYEFFRINILKMKQLFEDQNNSTQLVDIVTQIIETANNKNKI